MGCDQVWISEKKMGMLPCPIKLPYAIAGKQLQRGVELLMNKKRETKIVKVNITTSRVAVLVLCVHNSAL